jgi:hypothetical protein
VGLRGNQFKVFQQVRDEIKTGSTGFLGDDVRFPGLPELFLALF